MRHCLAVLGALLVACSPDRAPSPEATPAADTATAATVPGDTLLAGMTCESFLGDGLRVAPTRAALADEFGAPDSVRAWAEPNRHVPDVTDSLFDVHYAGLFVHIRTPHGGNDMPDLARVTDNRFMQHAGLGIGAPGERLVRVLGEPSERSDTQLRYECSEVAAPVTFTLARGVVTGIELDYYVD